MNREVVTISPGTHPSRLNALNNLSFTLRTLFTRHSGKEENIDEAILLSRETVEQCSTLHPTQPIFMNNLGASLIRRFGQSGQLQDLDECIFLHKETLELCPASLLIDLLPL